MNDLSVEDIKRLVEKEKKSEEQLRRAEDEANRIVEQARVEAKRIMSSAEDASFLKTVSEGGRKHFEDRKRTIENETSKALDSLRFVADKNKEKTVALIISFIFGE